MAARNAGTLRMWERAPMHCPPHLRAIQTFAMASGCWQTRQYLRNRPSFNVPTDRDYQGVTTGAKAVDTRHNIAFRYFEDRFPFRV